SPTIPGSTTVAAEVDRPFSRPRPMGSLCEVEPITGPLILARYNMYAAVPINGNTAPGVSSGEAIDVVADLARREAPAMTHEWTEIIFIQLLAGNTSTYLFLASVLDEDDLGPLV